MSGFNGEKEEKFFGYCMGIISGEEDGRKLFDKYRDVLKKVNYRDVIHVFHRLTETEYPMDMIKNGVNKILHAVFTPLNEFEFEGYLKDGVFDLMIRDNLKMEDKLTFKIKPLIKEVNRKVSKEIILKLKEGFQELSLFKKHYDLKENFIFPLFEKSSEYTGCLKIMWSFDVDIRRNLKRATSILEEDFDVGEFNVVVGRLFFDMFAISFRENKILFPYLYEIVDEDVVNEMLPEMVEFGFPFLNLEGVRHKKDVDIKEKIFNGGKKKVENPGEVELEYGFLLPQEISLIFSHLPVDITYVNERDEVKFFSSPKKRIFPRTKAILGRKVQNCHPQESLDVVNKILSEFKMGKKDRAIFWIDMNGRKILISYFALRDKMGNYKGVIEVTQDITEIKKIEGEKRLLDA